MSKNTDVIEAEVIAVHDDTELLVYEQLIVDMAFDPTVEPYDPDIYDMVRRLSGQSMTTWTRDNAEQLNQWLETDDAAAVAFRLKQARKPELEAE